MGVAKGSPMDEELRLLEAGTIFILREAHRRIAPLGMLWSVGKDSTALLWMARKAFLGTLPFPVALLDTGMEFPEVYQFRDKIVAEWGLSYVNHECPPQEYVDQTLPPAARTAMRKTEGLKTLAAELGWKGVILGIRRDEQATRAKERVFSPRNRDGSWNYKDQPAEFLRYFTTQVPDGAHLRIHPLLAWTELDVWRYIRAEKIPFCSLYLSDGERRFRSLGERNITLPVESTARDLDEVIAELEATHAPERAGRTMDFETEDAFERLRTGGYM